MNKPPKCPPLEEWVRYAHYVADGDYSRKVDTQWETWNPASERWYPTPNGLVNLIEREMAR